METQPEPNLVKKTIQLVTSIINVFYFGFGVALFVIGVLYLTSYFYEETFTAFNPTVVAGIFVPFGIVIAFLAMINIICLLFLFCRSKRSSYFDKSGNEKPKRQSPFIMGIIIAFCSGFILILFIVLLAIGIWGLVVHSNGQSLRNEVNTNLLSAVMRYNGFNADTDGINWVQRRFKCCGINGFNDWSFYANAYNSNPLGIGYFKCYVPTSCCINENDSCTFTYLSTCNGYNRVINTNGCLNPFLEELNKDILFLGAFTVSIASLAIVLWIINLLFFFLCF